MARAPASKPASAQALYRALQALGTAPQLDPRRRAGGPTPHDALPLLGSLLARTETDAFHRAPTDQDPPASLTRLLAGYQASTSPTPGHLPLLAHRLTRTALETSLETPATPLTQAAQHAAQAAAHLLQAHYHLSDPDPHTSRTHLHQARHHLTQAQKTLTRPHR
ncbi:hypothetical protein ACFWJT_34730 [Streptomyces sp. NPDC127069]|uniref:hypothetical protein n=1 Tax=Streptomyces sp. NPDC127069 TaxID=3347128 RepID=UPI00364F0D15